MENYIGVANRLVVLIQQLRDKITFFKLKNIIKVMNVLNLILLLLLIRTNQV